MSDRATLHRLVDNLPEEEVAAVERFLASLETLDPVERTLLLAPADDEPDRDDADGGLSRAREEAARGESVSSEELKRELGIR